MQYMRAYQSVFDNPKWTTNLLFGALCQIVPFVGPIVWMGYVYEGVEVMHRQQRDIYPDFDTKRLMPYLLRGLWVFIVNLIPGVVLVPIVMICYVLVLVLGSASQEPALVGLGMLCMFPIIIGAQAALALVSVPLSLRAGLTQDLGASFNIPFIRDFVGRVWQPVILTFLFIVVTGIPLAVLGAMCCVGLYPAAALIGMAQGHLHYQVYEEYLRRGGEPIPFKEETV